MANLEQSTVLILDQPLGNSTPVHTKITAAQPLLTKIKDRIIMFKPINVFNTGHISKHVSDCIFNSKLPNPDIITLKTDHGKRNC